MCPTLTPHYRDPFWGKGRHPSHATLWKQRDVKACAPPSFKRRNCCSPFQGDAMGWPPCSTGICSLSPHTLSTLCPRWSTWLMEETLVLYPWEKHTGMRWNILLNWPMHSHNLFFCSFLFCEHPSKLFPAVTTSSPQAWTYLLIFILLYVYSLLQTISDHLRKLKQIVVSCQPRGVWVRHLQTQDRIKPRAQCWPTK